MQSKCPSNPVLGLVAVAVWAAACSAPGKVVGTEWRHVVTHEGTPSRAVRLGTLNAARVAKTVHVEIQVRLVDEVEVWNEYLRTDRHVRRWRGVLAGGRPESTTAAADPPQIGFATVPSTDLGGARQPVEKREVAAKIPGAIMVRWAVDDPALVGAKVCDGIGTLNPTGTLAFEVDERSCREVAARNGTSVVFAVDIENQPVGTLRLLVPRRPFQEAAGVPGKEGS